MNKSEKLINTLLKSHPTKKEMMEGVIKELLKLNPKEYYDLYNSHKDPHMHQMVLDVVNAINKTYDLHLELISLESSDIYIRFIILCKPREESQT